MHVELHLLRYRFSSEMRFYSWLLGWLSWLADSPVSMIQCLELVKRQPDYRDIAESGLAFARALARFDCNAIRNPSKSVNGENVTAEEGTRNDPDETLDAELTADVNEDPAQIEVAETDAEVGAKDSSEEVPEATDTAEPTEALSEETSLEADASPVVVEVCPTDRRTRNCQTGNRQRPRDNGRGER